MAKGSMNSTLLYVGIAVAAVAVLALVYYGSPGAAMKSIGLEGFSEHDKKEEGFANSADEDEEQFATMEDDADEDVHQDKADAPAPEETKEGFYGGYDSSNKDYAAAGGAPGRAGVPSTDHANCYTRDGLNPTDLLPKASAEASQFLASNPPTKGSPDNRNLLQAGYHIGIDTVCQTNKNANLQLRSDPPIARCGTQPIFNSSSIPAQQNNRLALEIGSQINPDGCADFKKDSMYPQ
jgi:hypothetical protein